MGLNLRHAGYRSLCTSRYARAHYPGSNVLPSSQARCQAANLTHWGPAGPRLRRLLGSLGPPAHAGLEEVRVFDEGASDVQQNGILLVTRGCLPAQLLVQICIVAAPHLLTTRHNFPDLVKQTLANGGCRLTQERQSHAVGR